jgi:predicted small integral membrane protein
VRLKAQGVRLLEKVYLINWPRNLDADPFGIRESDPLIGYAARLYSRDTLSCVVYFELNVNRGVSSVLRKAKSIMILTVALWGFIGAFHNVLDWSGTIGAVSAATSMSTIPEGAESWQATDSMLVIWIGALFIVASKLATGTLCGIGAFRMWKAQSSDLEAYKAAREIALTGCAIAMIMLFGGFVVIAESWFELWRSESMIGLVLQSAFRYGGMITLIGLFVASND